VRTIALRSLFHDRSKLFGAVAGVSFAALLVIVQLGTFAGFMDTSSSMIAHMGGDVWVMPRGTEVMDSVETLGPASRALALAHPCVARVRPLVFTWALIRLPGGARNSVRMIGIQPGDEPILPWSFARGVPSDLRPPMRIAIDGIDLGKLHIEGDPIGAQLEIGGQTATVAAVSRGVRSFTLLPFIFAKIEDARRMTGMSDGEANYWVLDLKDKSCEADVIRSIERDGALAAVPQPEWLARTQHYWVVGSGAGAVVAFSAMLGLIVGIVIVGQTLYSMTKDYRRELATLKAVGGSDAEVVGFVAWQAGFLATVGIVVGGAGSFGMQRLAERGGMEVLLAPWVLVVGVGTVALMCAGASLVSVRGILKLRAAEVFQ
jgi:putative ABC transport system permease protein